MLKQTVSEKVLHIALPLAKELGLEMVDVELIKERGNMVLRILIDREEGVRIEDCEAVSRALDEQLDQLDLIPFSYTLEVSSAGVERPLKKKADYIRFKGRLIRVNLFSPQDGKKNIVGILHGLAEDRIIIEEETSVLLQIPFNQIAKANLVYTPNRL